MNIVVTPETDLARMARIFQDFPDGRGIRLLEALTRVKKSYSRS